MDLSPSGDAWLDVEPVSLAFIVLVDLIAEGWSRTDQRHFATNDIPELRQLVEREPAKDRPHSGDPSITFVDGVAGTYTLCTDNHRSQLQQLKVLSVFTDTRLAVQHRPASELDGKRGNTEQRACEYQTSSRKSDIERPVHRVPSATSQVAGTPRRR